MQISARGLNRALLARQLLLRRERLDVADAVARVVALQAQTPASPYLALWNRLTDVDPAAVDAAFADGTLVKATTLRITLHAVRAVDYPTFHQAMQPSLRGARLGDRRFTSTGLSAADADALVPGLLEFTRQPRPAAEVERWIGERVDVAPKRIWWALRTYAPLRHAPTGGPWSFGSRTVVTAASATPRPRDREAADEALQVVARRYLEGFGPGSVADLAQFALVQRSRAREALEAIAGDLVRLEGPDGAVLYDVPGATLPEDDAPAPPRLLGMWDNALLAHVDRSRIIPPEYRPLVTRSNGDVLPTLLVDGYVAGVWRPVDGGLEATAFSRLPDEAWAGLAAEARALTGFLADRDERVYSRYAHWWTRLPEGERRVLPG